MRGQKAHHYLENAFFEGEYVLNGYYMYDLGSFLGIKEASNGVVYGEDMLPRMDRYEGESLYSNG